MSPAEREALQKISERLHELLRRAEFDGTTQLYDELQSIAGDLDALLD